MKKGKDIFEIICDKKIDLKYAKLLVDYKIN
jgi:hypothetical protein